MLPREESPLPENSSSAEQVQPLFESFESDLGFLLESLHKSERSQVERVDFIYSLIAPYFTETPVGQSFSLMQAYAEKYHAEKNLELRELYLAVVDYHSMQHLLSNNVDVAGYFDKRHIH